MSDAEKRSILLVDDDSTLRRMFVVALNYSGYRVRDAENGRIAQELFLQEPPDLLVTDLQMPEMDGLALVQWVRGEKESTVPILVLTSLGERSAGKQALEMGADRVATKPVDLNRLLAEIRELLNK